jgi:hypothetical protein
MGSLTTKLISDSKEILKYLQIGTKIPIWNEFHKYILHDLNHFQAKSLLLLEDGNPVGNVLIYNNGSNILYFGYFGIINDDNSKIDFLVKSLIDYANSNNFVSIRGPINIPTIIFGWGFMDEGSLENVFIGKPVNSPNYIKLFFDNKFHIDIKELSWEGSVKIYKSLQQKTKRYDYTDYELFFPKDWNEMLKMKKIFLNLNARNLSPESIRTPDIPNVFENYLKFVIEYGDFFMFPFVRHKPSYEIIACMAAIPNPFRKSDKGSIDSFNYFTYVVEKEHRGKGIGWLIAKEVFEQAKKNNMTYFSSPVVSSQQTIREMAKKIGVSSLRTHLILRYET